MATIGNSADQVNLFPAAELVLTPKFLSGKCGKHDKAAPTPFGFNQKMPLCVILALVTSSKILRIIFGMQKYGHMVIVTPIACFV